MADQKTPPVHHRESREQALARALRDNLRRRKAPAARPPLSPDTQPDEPS